jgi:hypothetical protein
MSSGAQGVRAQGVSGDGVFSPTVDDSCERAFGTGNTCDSSVHRAPLATQPSPDLQAIPDRHSCSCGAAVRFHWASRILLPVAPSNTMPANRWRCACLPARLARSATFPVPFASVPHPQRPGSGRGLVGRRLPFRLRFSTLADTLQVPTGSEAGGGHSFGSNSQLRTNSESPQTSASAQSL